MNLNSTFNYKGTGGQNGRDGSEAHNATVVIEDAVAKEAELNATFQIEEEVQISPCNNNVYHLNNTFTAASSPAIK